MQIIEAHNEKKQNSLSSSTHPGYDRNSRN